MRVTRTIEHRKIIALGRLTIALKQVIVPLQHLAQHFAWRVGSVEHAPTCSKSGQHWSGSPQFRRAFQGWQIAVKTQSIDVEAVRNLTHIGLNSVDIVPDLGEAGPNNAQFGQLWSMRAQDVKTGQGHAISDRLGWASPNKGANVTNSIPKVPRHLVRSDPTRCGLDQISSYLPRAGGRRCIMARTQGWWKSKRSPLRPVCEERHGVTPARMLQARRE